MSVIAILGLSSELELLQRQLQTASVESSPAGTFWSGQWGDHDVILANCAVGKVNATMALQWLMDHRMPDLLLNCGSAGGIAPEVRVGDLVIADRLIPYDAGVFLPKRFVTTGNELPGGKSIHWRCFRAAPGLMRAATEAAELVGMSPATRGVTSEYSTRYWIGPVASGDQVVFADEPKQWLSKAFGALAVENEGAAVAQVASAHGIPWLVLRVISDSADSRAAFDYTPLLRYADEGAGWLPWIRFQLRRLLHVLRHPETRTNWRQFEKGVNRVNENLAALLHELLPLL